MPPEEPQEYNEETIVVLEQHEHARLRPGMYVGGTDIRALHTMIFEFLNDYEIEFRLGWCKRVRITLTHDGFVVIEDDGRRLPIHEQTIRGQSKFDLIMTGLGMRQGQNGEYKSMGSTAGLGFYAVANNLSSSFTIEVRIDDKIWYQTFHEGVAQHPLESREAGDERFGSRVTFKPDDTIFETTTPDFKAISQKAKELAAVFPGAMIAVRDEITNQIAIHRYENGIADYVTQLAGSDTTFKEPLYSKVMFTEQHDHYEVRIEIEVAIQYTNKNQIDIVAFANSRHSNQGTHIDGFRQAIEEHFASHKTKTNNGMVAVISLHHTHLWSDYVEWNQYKSLNRELHFLTHYATKSAL